MIKNKQKILLSILLLFVVLSGCNSNDDDSRLSINNSNGEVTKISSTTPIDQSLTNQAKEYVHIRDEVKSVRGVNTAKDLLLAIQVAQLKQFKEQKYESKIQKDLEKQFPDVNIQVSSDQKIYLEIEKLEKQIQDNSINKQELEKRLNQLKKLMNDEA